MNETRQSLLVRAQAGEANAWKDLTELYRPLILGWLNRQGVPARDWEDLSQDILLSVVKHLPAFQLAPGCGPLSVAAPPITGGLPTRALKAAAAAVPRQHCNRSRTPTAA